MLKSRNLDDQSFEEIVQGAVGRLPWLCPSWTDHNAHDPGVTVLELMAWYKEMQQYHMNQFTPELEWKLLKLCSVERQPARAALCTVEVPPSAPGQPVLSRLTNREDISFELLQPVPAQRPTLTRVCIRQGEQLVDVRELLGGGVLTFQPFRFGGHGGTELLLGFHSAPGGCLRIWFEVEPPAGTPRTPFDADSEDPRRLAWELVGVGTVVPLLDETHALSVSGYVELETPAAWPEMEPGELRWLAIRLLEPGCEEQVRLKWVSASRYRAAQQETRAKSCYFTVVPGSDRCVTLTDGVAQEAELSVFLRGPAGWVQTAEYTAHQSSGGRMLVVDASAAEAGADNLLVVCLDPVRRNDLIFSSSGRPGETLYLNLGGQTALTEGFSLLCSTLHRDGVIRPAVWHCVEDFYHCGPRDCVFTYDSLRETITFGDGLHGAVVPRGEGAVLVSDLVLSYCGSGNVPEDAGLAFTDGTGPLRNSPARGGRDLEQVEAAAARFLRSLGTTSKCVSAGDYACRAKETPGRRVLHAKALPGYDPQAPVPGVSPAVVTVVVIPDAGAERAMPDEPFLSAVRRQLERYRPVCVRVEVIAPRYVEISVTAQLRCREGVDRQAVRQELEGYFSHEGAGIGGPISKAAVKALLQRQSGVLQVRRLELHAGGADCYHTPSGDIRIPPNAVPCLGTLELELTRT